MHNSLEYYEKKIEFIKSELKKGSMTISGLQENKDELTELRELYREDLHDQGKGKEDKGTTYFTHLIRLDSILNRLR